MSQDEKYTERFSAQQVAEFLPEAIEEALKTYKEFFKNSDDDKESNKFKRKNDACKAAIAHIKALIDLAKWADGSNNEGKAEKEEQVALTSIIKEAQGEVARYEASGE